MEIPENLIERFHAALRIFYETNERKINAKVNITEELRVEYMKHIQDVCLNVEAIGKNTREMLEYYTEFQKLYNLAESLEHPYTNSYSERLNRIRQSTQIRVADLLAMILQMEEGKFPSGYQE